MTTRSGAGLQTLSANEALGDDFPDTKDVPVKLSVKPSVNVFFDIVAKLVDMRHVPKPPHLPTHRPKHLPLVVQRGLYPRIFTQIGGMVLGLPPLTVLAHNFQGYNNYPVINTFQQLKKELGQINNGAKVLQVTCLWSSVRFIHSMSF